MYRLYGCAPLIRVWLFGSDSGNRGIKFTLYHLKRGTFYFSFTLEQGRTSLIRDYSQSSSVWNYSVLVVLSLNQPQEQDLFMQSLSRTESQIGHIRVPKTLTFKMRLGAQPFLWKWVLFAWEWKMISIYIKGWAPTLVLKQRPLFLSGIGPESQRLSDTPS